VNFGSDGYAPLRALRGSLRRLALVKCLQLPACLPQLTALEALMVDDAEERLQEAASAGDVVVAALPRLAHLTFLALDRPPAALAGITTLRSFHWSFQWDEEDVLPAGAWLSGLERLEAHVDVLRHSLPALRSASRLQYLGVWCDKECSLEQLSPLLPWAASHPTLQQLLINAEPELLAAAFGAACAAQRRNPRLVMDSDEDDEVLTPTVLHELCFGLPFGS